MVSIITEIEKRTLEHPNKRLFAFLDIKGNILETYTYAEFEQSTKNCAVQLLANTDFSQGDRVLLAFPPGLDMIKAFFGCVRLGLIPVPVYPPAAHGFEASVQKMNFIATDCGAKAVLTDSSCFWSYKVNVSRTKTHVSDLKWIVLDDEVDSESTLPPIDNQELLFIQYTSGSTNDPKGVMVTHANIIQNCANVVDHMPIGISWLPQYHDMGLIGYYLFFALKGGTTYGFSATDFMQRPALWLEAITKFKATASSAPNFAYDYCLMPGKIPDASFETLDLSSLSFLMTASEPIQPAIYRAFLEKFKPVGLKEESFFGAYGLAEFTLAVTNHGRTTTLFDADQLKLGKAIPVNHLTENQNGQELMSCGKALFETTIKIVDPQTGKPSITEGEIGEIWLDGTSKCLGYWNRPELTKAVFEANLTGENGSNHWLRTGDLGFMHADELYVCGRIKDLIILRGLNYYPQDIENVIEKDQLIRNGCVVAFTVEKQGKEALIVIVGIKNATKIPEAKIIQTAVNQYLGISISEIVFVPARTISKTSSGKLKRYENKKKYLAKELQIIDHVMLNHIDDTNESEHPLVENDSSSTLFDYQILLRNYKLTGLESAVLGDAGLDSMKLAEFGHDLKAHLELKGFDDLSQEVDLKLLQRIAVSELFAILKELDAASRFARFKFRKSFSKIRSEYEQSEIGLMVKDTSAPSKLENRNQLLEKQTKTGAILLTGGTGFFGPFLLKSLLEQTTDDMYVLVRADSLEAGKNRLMEAFLTINPTAQALAEFKNRVQPICGDLSKTKLGINHEDWDFLSQTIHTIYHNGAYVNYMMDYESMRQINVGGTNAVIELAITTREKHVNYISTTFIFGWSNKEILFESDSNEAMQLLDFGYSQSKWVADQVMLKAMKNGLQARIFRPALIAPSTNGDGYNFDISIRLLAFMLKYGIGTSAQNQVSFTPADSGANNIVAIANIDSSIGHTFHVTRDQFSTMQDVTDKLAELAGKSFQNFDLKTFVPEVVSRCEKHDLLFPLLNFLVRSVDNISAMEFKRYDNSNYRKFRSLSPWGKEDQSLDEVVKGIYLFMKNNHEIQDSLETTSVTNAEIQPKMTE